MEVAKAKELVSFFPFFHSAVAVSDVSIGQWSSSETLQSKVGSAER